MPSINGRLEINLTVRDPGASTEWYRRLFGFELRYDHTSDDGSLRYVSLADPASGFVLCLVGHAANDGTPFDETRTGLDHLELLVASRADLDGWAARLDELGVAHSGVKDPGHTPNAMLTFRDPDGIALELFHRAAPATDMIET